MDRRAVFFFVAAVACFAMVPVGLEKYREIAAATGIVYVVLGILSSLDKWSRSRTTKR
jgi:hypothetical protein